MKYSIMERDPNSAPAGLNFEERIPESRKRVYAIAYKILHNRSDAEDVVQETLVRAWSSLAEFDPRRSFNAWISRIATNICIDRLRRRSVRKDVSLEESLTTETFDPAYRIDLADFSHDPEKLLMANELDDELKLGIQALPAAYRDCLLLLAQEHSYSEIAARLDCPVGTVRSRLCRARLQLSRSLRTTR